MSGVTLISATMPGRRDLLLNAMWPSGRQTASGSAADARGVDAVHARLEVVVEDDRHDADRSQRRGDQRLEMPEAPSHPPPLVPGAAIAWRRG